MKRSEAVQRMILPGQRRENKRNGGCIQIWLTRQCDRACFGCTQGSNLSIPGGTGFITLAQFEQACKSLQDYFGTVGIFGGNPALHPKFPEICEILRRYIPLKRRGLWCNNPMGHGKVMAETFNPAVSNLNVHLSQEAFQEFKRDWPNSLPFGQKQDSRHSPPFVAIQDIIHQEEDQWERIARCDINRHWSAMICVVRGNLRGYFCEIAGAQAILHQHDTTYLDLGIEIVPNWWKGDTETFIEQIQFHCPACGVPFRGYGELACAENGTEQYSLAHHDIYKPKIKGRKVELVTSLSQVCENSIPTFTDYVGNAKR